MKIQFLIIPNSTASKNDTMMLRKDTICTAIQKGAWGFRAADRRKCPRGHANHPCERSVSNLSKQEYQARKMMDQYGLMIIDGIMCYNNIILCIYIYITCHVCNMDIYIYGGCPKYLFPDSPQSLSQSRSNRGTTVSNRGRVCSSLIRSYT